MKLFVLLSRFPYPLDKGDKLRAFHQIKDLSEQHEIHLCCVVDRHPSEADLDVIKQYCTQVHCFKIPSYLKTLKAGLALFGKRPLQVGMFYSLGIKRKINKLIQEINPDHIYCQLIRTSEYVKEQFGIPKTIDYMDALSTGMLRMSSESRFPFKQIYRLEAKRLTQYENLIFDYFDHHLIISEQDRDLIYHPNRKDIKIIANGVDLEAFTSLDVPKSYDLVFHGNMSYPPNIKSAEFICQQILPLAKEQGHVYQVLISGTQPHAKVLALKSDQVTISGWVDDVRSSYCSAQIFLAPMLINTGLQNKILEAMALGIPCISSPMANNAIGAKANLEIVIANSAADYISQIDRLLNDSVFYQKISENGKLFVQNNYSWRAKNTELNDLLNSKS